MIDTHCHLTFRDFIGREDEVVAKAREAGVDRMITVGITPEDAARAVGLAERFAGVFATVGLHPHYAAEFADPEPVGAAMRLLSGRTEVVALGEMGLDRHYPDPPLEDQKRLFGYQLEIAAGIDLPIIIHNREATDETIAMIRAGGVPGERFVFHCFTGDEREVDAILDLGAMVSFTGISTFKNAKTIADCAARAPLERIMVETDSPYLTPEPYRKVRPNEPCYVPYVARFLAERRGMEEGEFVAQMDANAERFFRLN